MAIVDDGGGVQVGGNVGGLGLLVDEHHLVAIGISHHGRAHYLAIRRVIVGLGGVLGRGSLVARATLHRAAGQGHEPQGHHAGHHHGQLLRLLHRVRLSKGVENSGAIIARRGASPEKGSQTVGAAGVLPAYRRVRVPRKGG